MHLDAVPSSPLQLQGLAWPAGSVEGRRAPGPGATCPRAAAPPPPPRDPGSKAPAPGAPAARTPLGCDRRLSGSFRLRCWRLRGEVRPMRSGCSSLLSDSRHQMWCAGCRVMDVELGHSCGSCSQRFTCGSSRTPSAGAFIRNPKSRQAIGSFANPGTYAPVGFESRKDLQAFLVRA
jgi:hypothetical protein